MVEKSPQKWIFVDDKLVEKIKLAINAALAYETATGKKRKLGITAEVGEILVCHHFGLRLMLDARAEGFDALDNKEKRVQIKTRRSELKGLPRDVGRVGQFSKHPFDYALLALLDQDYNLCEVWQADYNNLLPIIEKEKKRNPHLSSFKRVAKKILPLE